MSPPTEQLIRDYLNRMSVAARGRLGTEDRKALVLRTRDFIERNANLSGAPTSRQVAALLSRLGDPAELVGQAVVKLAAARGEAPPEPPAERRRLGRPRAGSRQASWHWPSPTGSADLQARLLRGLIGQQSEVQPAAVSSEAASQATEPAVGRSQAAQRTAEPVERDDARAEPPIWVPRQPPAPADSPAEFAGVPDRVDAGVVGGARRSGGGTARDDGMAAADAGRAPGTKEATTRPGPESLSGAAEPEPLPGMSGPVPVGGESTPAGRSAGALAASILELAKRHPAEAVAVTLLGLGGAVFPPVWLLGVVAALPCKVWDYRDKWIGLAGPVLLLIVGTVAGLMLTSRQASFGGYVHEAWVYLNITSRLAALLGAGYLWRRVMQGKRAPAVPPWNRPRRIS